MLTIKDPAMRKKRKQSQLARLKKKGWKPPKEKGKKDASH